MSTGLLTQLQSMIGKTPFLGRFVNRGEASSTTAQSQTGHHKTISPDTETTDIAPSLGTSASDDTHTLHSPRHHTTTSSSLDTVLDSELLTSNPVDRRQKVLTIYQQQLKQRIRSCKNTVDWFSPQVNPENFFFEKVASELKNLIYTNKKYLETHREQDSLKLAAESKEFSQSLATRLLGELSELYRLKDDKSVCPEAKVRQALDNSLNSPRMQNLHKLIFMIHKSGLQDEAQLQNIDIDLDMLNHSQARQRQDTVHKIGQFLKLTHGALIYEEDSDKFHIYDNQAPIFYEAILAKLIQIELDDAVSSLNAPHKDTELIAALSKVLNESKLREDELASIPNSPLKYLNSSNQQTFDAKDIAETYAANNHIDELLQHIYNELGETIPLHKSFAPVAEANGNYKQFQRTILKLNMHAALEAMNEHYNKIPAQSADSGNLKTYFGDTEHWQYKYVFKQRVKVYRDLISKGRVDMVKVELANTAAHLKNITAPKSFPLHDYLRNRSLEDFATQLKTNLLTHTRLAQDEQQLPQNYLLFFNLFMDLNSTEIESIFPENTSENLLNLERFVNLLNNSYRNLLDPITGDSQLSQEHIIALLANEDTQNLYFPTVLQFIRNSCSSESNCNEDIKQASMLLLFMLTKYGPMEGTSGGNFKYRCELANVALNKDLKETMQATAPELCANIYKKHRRKTNKLIQDLEQAIIVEGQKVTDSQAKPDHLQELLESYMKLEQNINKLEEDAYKIEGLDAVISKLLRHNPNLINLIDNLTYKPEYRAIASKQGLAILDQKARTFTKIIRRDFNPFLKQLTTLLGYEVGPDGHSFDVHSGIALSDHKLQPRDRKKIVHLLAQRVPGNNPDFTKLTQLILDSKNNPDPSSLDSIVRLITTNVITQGGHIFVKSTDEQLISELADFYTQTASLLKLDPDLFKNASTNSLPQNLVELLSIKPILLQIEGEVQESPENVRNRAKLTAALSNLVYHPTTPFQNLAINNKVRWIPFTPQNDIKVPGKLSPEVAKLLAQTT